MYECEPPKIPAGHIVVDRENKSPGANFDGFRYDEMIDSSCRYAVADRANSDVWPRHIMTGS